MTFHIPAYDYKIDKNGEKRPNYDLIQGKAFRDLSNEFDTERDEINLQLMSIFDLPLIIILKNIANTIMAIISELSMRKTYKNRNIFFMTFLKNNRLIYIGIITIFISLFFAFFFD